MEFAAQQTIPNSNLTYAISPAIKQYTLLDLGFEKTKAGNFKYSGSLDRQNPFQPAAKLNIMVNADLTGFKLSLVNATGMKTVDIFKLTRAAEFQTQLDFIMAEMIERGIFVQA